MPNDKPNGSVDLLARAIRRVHQEQVEGVKKDIPNESAAPAKEVERQIEKR